jgi:zinc/manganese transport system substrate-binding protein
MSRSPSAHLRLSLVVFASTLTLPMLAGCASDADTQDSGVVIVTSTNVYEDIASAVGGDLVTASAFVSSPDQDPHSYEANTRDILAMSKADIVIENGGGYDDFMDQLLEDSDEDPTVLNVVDLSGHTATAAGELNEHVWYDVAAIQELTAHLAATLGDADPDNAATFTSNAESFNSELQSLIDREAQLKDDVAGNAVGITELVPAYMIDALGLTNLTPLAFSEAIEEGEDVSVSVLEETLSLFTDHQVDALVYNEQTAGPITEQVKEAAEDAGIPIVGVTETMPDGDTYLTWMNSNLDQLQQALTAR